MSVKVKLRRPTGTFIYEWRGEELMRAQRAAAERAYSRIAPEVRAAIVLKAPRRSGRLQDSIRVRRTDRRTGEPGLQVSMVGYGFFVEHGTIKMRAQPFVRPVIIGKREHWVGKLSQLIKQFVEVGNKPRRRR